MFCIDMFSYTRSGNVGTAYETLWTTLKKPIIKGQIGNEKNPKMPVDYFELDYD